MLWHYLSWQQVLYYKYYSTSTQYNATGSVLVYLCNVS